MTDHEIVEVDRGPRRIAAQTVVNAPADELFAILANPHRHHEADGSGWVQPEVIGPRELQPGDKFRVSMKFAGKVPYSLTSKAIDVVKDRAVEWQHPAKHTWRWEFEPVDATSTRVTEIFDYSGSRAGRLLEKLGSVEQDRRSIRASLRRLQRRYATP